MASQSHIKKKLILSKRRVALPISLIVCNLLVGWDKIVISWFSYVKQIWTKKSNMMQILELHMELNGLLWLLQALINHIDKTLVCTNKRSNRQHHKMNKVRRNSMNSKVSFLFCHVLKQNFLLRCQHLL